MTARGLRDILPCKQFYMFIANLTPSSVNLWKFMIVASAFNAPRSMVSPLDDKSYMTEIQDQASTQWDSPNSVPANPCNPADSPDEQVEKNNAVKVSEREKNLKRQGKLQVKK